MQNIAMPTALTTGTRRPLFRRIERYSLEVHGHQGEVTAWTLAGPHLDLTESISVVVADTIGV
jgi:hypothetical protein